MRIKSREGALLEYDIEKVRASISKVMCDSGGSFYIDGVVRLATTFLMRKNVEELHARDVQEEVERALIDYHLYKTTRAYILKSHHHIPTCDSSVALPPT